MSNVRENRIPIMLNDDELSALDDWRFANRIGSRAAAIRTLIAIGLSADARVSIRDTFIYEKGLWPEFASTSLPKPSIEAQGEAA